VPNNGSWTPGGDLTDDQRTWVEILFPHNGSDLEWVGRHRFWVTEDGQIKRRAAQPIGFPYWLTDPARWFDHG
jgi:hypothetical protein